MIYLRVGDIFTQKVDVIGIPVNKVGVAGRGVAKLAAERYPVFNHEYRRGCSLLTPEAQRDNSGFVRFTNIGTPDAPQKYIAGIATKAHWTNDSNPELVYNSLKLFAEYVDSIGMFGYKYSVAIPALGCGLGRMSVLEFYEVVRSVYRIHTFQDVYVMLSDQHYRIILDDMSTRLKSFLYSKDNSIITFDELVGINMSDLRI